MHYVKLIPQLQQHTKMNVQWGQAPQIQKRHPCMVSGISQNTLPSGVPSPTVTGTPSNASQNFGHRRNMGAIVTNNRHIGRLNKLQESDDYQDRFKAEIDTRADTVCAGQGFELIHQTGRIADVSGFHSDLGAITSVPIAQVATAYYDTADQETLILACFQRSPLFWQDNGDLADPSATGL
jgi:hypothetical protein